MPYRLIIAGLASLAVAACGDNSPSPDAEPSARERVTKQAPKHRFKGTITLERVDPYGPRGVVNFSLRSGTYTADATGSQPYRTKDRLVFLRKCGERGISKEVAVQDEDGFANAMSPCSDYGYKATYSQPKLSPNGKLVALYDHEIENGKKPSGYGIRKIPGIQVYSSKSKLEGTVFGLTSPAFAPNGDLYGTGTGSRGDGIFKVNRRFSNAERIDDGRLQGASHSLVIHPKGTHALFVNNGHLWEMSLKTGKPRRIHVHSHEIGYATYSPDGTKLAFIARDPLREAVDLPGSKRISIFDEGDVIPVAIDFTPSGPLTWLD